MCTKWYAGVVNLVIWVESEVGSRVDGSRPRARRLRAQRELGPQSVLAGGKATAGGGSR